MVDGETLVVVEACSFSAAAQLLWGSSLVERSSGGENILKWVKGI